MYFEFSKTEKTFCMPAVRSQPGNGPTFEGTQCGFRTSIERKESQQPQRGEAFKITDLAN